MKQGELNIGEYQEGDLAEIICIERDSFPSPWSENLFRSEMTTPISRLLIGRLGRNRGEVVGYIVYWLVDNEIHLHHIAVRSDMRRQRIASQLLEEAIRLSRPEGASRITLEVRDSNIPARKMYEKFGFAVRGVRPGYYDDTREDALILWADLRAIPWESGAKAGRERKVDD